jgi:predicted unusual protein kinase regulating ubiquinone biosynthesis (AarF/ABC1/UbiB family)
VSQHPLAQLRRYDSDAIAQYYQNRPWLGIKRTLTILWFFGGFILSLKKDEWFNQVEQKKYKRAAQLRQILTHLGPTFIKVGQALSTRPDLVRKDFLEELIKLQDQLPPFDNQIAFNIIETELKRSVKEPIAKSPQIRSPQLA